jgi:ubiquinone/menaquinone biosynthesis C-methylase UbiE
MKQEIGKYEGRKARNYYDVVRSDAEEKFGIDANVFKYLKEIIPKNLKNKVILDLGCGDGRWSEYLSKLGAKKVFGIDISQDMLDLAKQRIKDKLLSNIKIIRADIQNLPFSNFSIDLAFSVFSLMYFRNLEAVIKEIGRTLKNGGHLYIATNIIQIDKKDVEEKLKGTSVPVILGIDNRKIPVENLVQPRKQYLDAFSASGLVLEQEKYFEPEGVVIANDFEYKRDLILRKAFFKLSKIISNTHKL